MSKIEKEVIQCHYIKSKEEFCKQYCQCDVDSAQKLHFEILNEILVALTNNDSHRFNELCLLINCINNLTNTETLQKSYDHVDNPMRGTNIIILICKENRNDILLYVFKNKTILNDFASTIGKSMILPHDEDREHHTAFYYAIRSGNINLLDTLVSKWPDRYMSNELDILISKAYEELKLKNVQISDQMEMFAANKLINLRFWNERHKIQKYKVFHKTDILERLDLLLRNIGFLQMKHVDREADESFLLTAKYVAQNIHVLKRQLKVTYDKIPWEEMEFYVIVFIDSYTVKQCSDAQFINCTVVNKDKLLLYLQSFAKLLVEENHRIQITNFKKLTEIPNLKREVVIANIKKNSPELEKLYSDYRIIQDINSLEIINKYLDFSLDAESTTSEGQFTIMRTLQIVGENLKNTLQSPRLSNTTCEYLLCSLTRNTRNILIDLRDNLSHAFSLFARIEIDDKDNDFFNSAQNDIKKLKIIISDLLLKTKHKAIKMQLQIIINSDEMEEILKVNETFTYFKFEDMEIFSSNVERMEHSKINEIISKLRILIKDQTQYERELLNNMSVYITSEKSNLNHLQADYLTGLNALKFWNQTSNLMMNDNNSMKGIKHVANLLLEYFKPEINVNNSKKIINLFMKFCESVIPRLHEEVNCIKFQMSMLFVDDLNGVRWIEEMETKLNKSKNEKCGYSVNQIVSTHTEFDNQLSQKLSDLHELLLKNNLDSLSTEEISSYKRNKKLQAAIEMLVLDLLSILGENKKCLTDNQLFLDEYYPLLTGKVLRNYLAHGNTIANTLFCDNSIILLINATLLCNEKIIKNKDLMGKIVLNNVAKLQIKYEQDMLIVNNQSNMFNALVEGNIENIKKSIENGADINARSGDMWTALHYAAKGSNIECINFVRDQNISLGLKNIHGQSALHIAAMYGQKNSVEYLVQKKKMNVNDIDNSGKTCLHLAVQRGFRDVVLLLLKNKADYNKKDMSGLTPLHYAVFNNRTNIAEILLKIMDVENEIWGGYSLLNIAAEKGFLELVNLLLENKANVNARNDNMAIPLHSAALHGHLEVVTTLILKGSNVNVQNIDNCTPLHYATENGHEEIVSILLDHAAEVNVSDNTYNRTPISMAAELGHTEIVKSLIQHNADVNIASVDGVTALQFAAMKENVDIVDLLVKNGASVNHESNDGSTALHISSFNGNTDIVKYLVENNANINAKNQFNASPLHFAATNGKSDVIDILISKGVYIDLKDNNGNTALHSSCVDGHVSTIETLLRHGADMNIKSERGMTPLHVAVTSGVWRAVEILMERGADINSYNSKGDSALHLAAIFGHREVVQGLIENKCDINVKDTDGITPLHCAVIGNHLSVVEILTENGAEIDAMARYNKTAQSSSMSNLNKKSRKLENTNTAVNLPFGIPSISSLLTKLDNMQNDDLMLQRDQHEIVTNSFTPLCNAVRNNNKEIVSFLISKGADINNRQGICINLAIAFGFKDIAKLLMNHRTFDITAQQMNDNFTVLHLAAMKGHNSIVKDLLNKGVSVNSVFHGLTPLHFSSLLGHYEVVETLITHKANVNYQEDEGLTPLHSAAVAGHERVVELLLKSKANRNIRDMKFRTPVELAVAYGHLKIVENLLDNEETNINAKGTDDLTLLHIAAQRGHLELTKFLTNKGANIHSQNYAGSKPIHIAVRDGRKNIVEYFLGRNMNVNDPGVAGGSLLFYAAQGNQVNVTQFLLENKADPNISNLLGSTPIHMAAQFGFKDVVRVLLDNGAFYNAIDQQHCSPLQVAKTDDIRNLLRLCEELFQAVKKNDPTAIKLYLRKCDLLNIKNKSNETPLLYAVWRGYEEIVDLLLRNKANPNVTGKNDCSPLHYACKASHAGIVKNLLSHGAIYDAKTCKQKTPINFATDEEIIELLKLVDVAFKCVQNGNIKVIRDLEKLTNVDALKVIMNARNQSNKTLLVCAVHNDFPKINKLKNILQHVMATDVLMAEMLCFGEKYEEAQYVLEKGFEKKKHIYGSDNPSSFDAQIMIAITYYKQHNYAKALDIYKEVYEKQVNLFGVNNADAQATRNYIALVLYRQGKSEKALEIFREVLQIQREILGANDPKVLETQGNMILVLQNLRENEEALSLSYEVLEKEINIFGSNHPRPLRVQNNIAIILSNLKRYSESLKLFEKVYDGRRRILGPEHSDTLRTLFMIGYVLLCQKQDEEALKIFKQVLMAQKEILHPNHLDTLNTQDAIGVIYFNQAKFLIALKILEGVQERKIALLGSTHPDIKRLTAMTEGIYMKFDFQGLDRTVIKQQAENHFQLAAASGDKNVVETLVSCGVNVNSRDASGRSALHCAAASGHKETVIMLLGKGADYLQASTGKGNTALHFAAAKGYKEIVEIILQHVKKVESEKLNNFVNARTTVLGNTALHVACNIATVKILLKYGAIFDIKNKKGKKPFDVSGNEDIANMLLMFQNLFHDALREKSDLIFKLQRMTQDELLAIAGAQSVQGKTLLQVVEANGNHKLAGKLKTIMQRQKYKYNC